MWGGEYSRANKNGLDFIAETAQHNTGTTLPTGTDKDKACSGKMLAVAPTSVIAERNCTSAKTREAPLSCPSDPVRKRQIPFAKGQSASQSDTHTALRSFRVCLRLSETACTDEQTPRSCCCCCSTCPLPHEQVPCFATASND